MFRKLQNNITWFFIGNTFIGNAKLTITCSKLTIETLEQGVKYFQSQQSRHQNDASGVVLMSLLLTLNMFHTLL